MGKLEKIKNIEFLRIIGCLAVILLHYIIHCKTLSDSLINYAFYRHIYSMFCNGGKGVELFFILSGVFFTLTLNTQQSCFDFIKKKLIRLWPVLIFALCLAFIFSCFGFIKFHLYDNILTIFGLNGTALRFASGDVGVFWYVSAMLWTLLLLFYLRKYYKKENVNLFIALAISFCYSFLLHVKNGIIGEHVDTYYYVFNVGMMRAIGGIGIGYFIGEFYKDNVEKIKNYIPTLKTKLFFTLVEFMCLFFIINNLLLRRLKYNNQIIFVLVFALIILLFLVRKGYISQFLDKYNWECIAKYTYSTYVIHKLIFRVLTNSVWTTSWMIEHPFVNIIGTLVLVIGLGIFTYHFVEQPAKNYLLGMIKSNNNLLKERNI